MRVRHGCATVYGELAEGTPLSRWGWEGIGPASIRESGDLPGWWSLLCVNRGGSSPILTPESAGPVQNRWESESPWPQSSQGAFFVGEYNRYVARYVAGRALRAAPGGD